MRTKNESEEIKITLNLAGEVYYFLVAALVTVFLICSILSNNILLVEAICLILTIWLAPFVVIAAVNIFKFIIIKSLNERYGKKE